MSDRYVVNSAWVSYSGMSNSFVGACPSSAYHVVDVGTWVSAPGIVVCVCPTKETAIQVCRALNLHHRLTTMLEGL